MQIYIIIPIHPNNIFVSKVKTLIVIVKNKIEEGKLIN